MSIRQQNQINELLRRVEALEHAHRVAMAEKLAANSKDIANVIRENLPSKRKPGRPKNGQQESVSA